MVGRENDGFVLAELAYDLVSDHVSNTMAGLYTCFDPGIHAWRYTDRLGRS